MREIVIRYQNNKTLMLLKDIAKYFDFVIAPIETHKQEKNVTILPGNPSVNVEDLTKIFTGKNIDAVDLRKTVWQRKK